MGHKKTRKGTNGALEMKKAFYIMRPKGQGMLHSNDLSCQSRCWGSRGISLTSSASRDLWGTVFHREGT